MALSRCRLTESLAKPASHRSGEMTERMLWRVRPREKTQCSIRCHRIFSSRFGAVVRCEQLFSIKSTDAGGLFALFEPAGHVAQLIQKLFYLAALGEQALGHLAGQLAEAMFQFVHE